MVVVYSFVVSSDIMRYHLVSWTTSERHFLALGPRALHLALDIKLRIEILNSAIALPLWEKHAETALLIFDVAGLLGDWSPARKCTAINFRPKLAACQLSQLLQFDHL